MALDYVISMDCGPKQALGADGIQELLNARGYARYLLKVMREQGNQMSADQIRFRSSLSRPSNVTETEGEVHELIERTAVLDDYQHECVSCPANLRGGHGFGCYGRVNYPIDPEAEQLLLSMLPDDLTLPGAGAEFRRALEHFGWDGQQAAALRAQSRTFFKTATTPVRRWPTGETFTGDQVFQMLFMPVGADWSYAMMLAIAFRVIRLAEESGTSFEPAEPVAENALQAARFLQALAVAAERRLSVLMDG
ncbi:hypothetical protein ACIBEH_22055 [Nocardia salmonicida]|uniref:hypothetical protein n=1 Tax=Nocardia salmonicida TaxID=53431 RepID=UPI00379AC906